MDYRLPDGTGLDVLAHLREHSLNYPVVIMTSFNDVRTAVKSIQLGAIDYITKPVNPDELLMIIRGSLEKKAENNQTASVEHEDFIKGKKSTSS
ncbi:response regulator [Pedobacter sp. NJ-S-72]